MLLTPWNLPILALLYYERCCHQKADWYHLLQSGFIAGTGYLQNSFVILERCYKNLFQKLHCIHGDLLLMVMIGHFGRIHFQTGKKISASPGPLNAQRFKADLSFLFITDVGPLLPLITLLFCSCNWSRAIRENAMLVFGREKFPFMKLQNTSGRHWSKVARSNQYTVAHRE